MNHKMYAVWDSKVSCFAEPFRQRSKGEALRGWSEAVNDPNTQLHKHPEDYTLFELAEWDEITGKFINHEAPQSLGLAIEVKSGDIPPEFAKPIKRNIERYGENEK